jgi:signal transduction histidine kinase
MSSLLNALWKFNLAFLAAIVLLIVLLYLQSRYAKKVTDEVYETEENLNSALSKISTVDKEREALNSFVAAASHDLRQPLHALGLYLGALKRHVTSGQGQAILQNSFRSTEALNHLLNSMLDLSKLDAGVVEVNLAHIRLEEIFHSLRQTFQPEAQERDLTLSIKSTDIIVHTDPVLLERILGNLVSNALAYTDEGSVSIDATLEGNQVRICVEDTGQGIPKDEQKEIFNEYYQLHNPERDRTKGLGLGLSIVKRLSSLLEVDLELDSAPSRGSTFVLKVASGQVERCHSQVSAPSRQSDTDLNGLSILVIDDEADVRESMSTLLQQYRSEVVSVDSAESALAYIIEYEWVPDLIIADYRLRDDKKGDVAIQQVREEVNEDVPAMIITGDTSPERLREATASGFALMHKPVIASVLLDNVTQLIGEHA